MFRPPVMAGMLAITLFFGSALQLSALPNYSNAPVPASSTPLVTGTGAGSSTAIPTYGLGAEPLEGEDQSCQYRMGRFIEYENGRYQQWMDAHFNNKSSTTSLLDDALVRYKEFQNGLMNEYLKVQKIRVPEGVLQATEGIELGACRQLIEDALSLAQRGLEQKARLSSAAKKATALLSKYKEMNGKLRELNQNFLQMKAYLTTFSDKIPCYITSCNQG